MRIRSCGATDVGKKRERNEDNLLVNKHYNLFVVADGMGGHLGGDIASSIAVATMDDVITSIEQSPDATIQRDDIEIKAGEYQAYLRYAIKLAGKRIFEKADSDMSLHGMGTTVVSTLFRDGKAYIANVGDSRCYRIRNDEINQITKDHSLVAEQMRAGILSPDDARIQRFKNIITRSVGFQEEVDADVEIRVAKESDIYLLCSDGLSNMLSDEEIRDVIISNEIEYACNRLIDLANERGGEDNITLILMKVENLLDDDFDSLEDTVQDDGES